MPEVRIKVPFGEIVVPYSTVDELEAGLGDIKKVLETVQSKARNVTLTEPRNPKVGFEDIYRFTPSGRVELLVAPGKQGESVGLVLLGHDPEPPKSDVLEEETGVQKVVRNVLTTGAYKKYFIRLSDGRYTLTPEGKAWVADQVIPRLREKVKQANRDA